MSLYIILFDKITSFLRQSYEWALEATTYVSSLKAGKNVGPSELLSLETSLDLYLQEHPPVPAETFELMLDIAKKLDNDKLYEQCSIARTRCIETDHLLQERRRTLRQAREKLQAEEEERAAAEAAAMVRETESVAVGCDMAVGGDTVPCCSSQSGPSVTSSSSSHSSDSGRGAHPASSPISPPYPGSDHPQKPYHHRRTFSNGFVEDTSALGMSRRRSYAGKPSTPIYSPMAAAFKENMKDMNLYEYEEYLFNEGLITEDMSDRIVAFLPKGLSDSTLRGSRESLRGSVENLHASTENLARDPTSNADCSSSISPRTLDVAAGYGSDFPPPPSRTSGSRHRPQHKMLKKASSHSSCWVTENMYATGGAEVLPSVRESPLRECMSSDSRRNSRNEKSLSLLTGSNESLPW